MESALSLRDCREASSSGLRAPAPPLETLPGNQTNTSDLQNCSRLFVLAHVISRKIFGGNADSKQANATFVWRTRLNGSTGQSGADGVLWPHLELRLQVDQREVTAAESCCSHFFICSFKSLIYQIFEEL